LCKYLSSLVNQQLKKIYVLTPKMGSHQYHSCVTDVITIWFAGWISGRTVSLQPDTDIQKLPSNDNQIS